MNEPTFFPGADYPDREIWLAKRYTDLRAFRDRGRVIYSGKKPLCLGINRIKRAERTAFAIMSWPGRRYPKRSPDSIIKARHNYYRTRYEATQS